MKNKIMIISAVLFVAGAVVGSMQVHAEEKQKRKTIHDWKDQELMVLAEAANNMQARINRGEYDKKSHVDMLTDFEFEQIAIFNKK